MTETSNKPKTKATNTRKFEIHDVEQRTSMWHALRIGHMTGSIYHKLFKRTSKGLPSKDNETYFRSNVIENYTNSYLMPNPLQRGEEAEAYALDLLHRLHPEYEINRVGFVQSKEFKYVGVSPDGFLDDDKLIEIKTLGGKSFLEMVETDQIPEEYLFQMRLQCYVTNRNRCLFFAFCPYMREPYNFYMKWYELTPEEEEQAYKDCCDYNDRLKKAIKETEKALKGMIKQYKANGLLRADVDYEQACRAVREAYITEQVTGMYVQNRETLSEEAQKAPNIFSSTEYEARRDYYSQRELQETSDGHELNADLFQDQATSDILKQLGVIK